MMQWRKMKPGLWWMFCHGRLVGIVGREARRLFRSRVRDSFGWNPLTCVTTLTAAKRMIESQWTGEKPQTKQRGKEIYLHYV